MTRTRLASLVLILAFAASVIVFARPETPPVSAPDPVEVRARASSAPSEAIRSGPLAPEGEPAPPLIAAGASDDDAPMSLFDDLFPSDDPAWAWAQVDLEGLREELPENAFWELAAPTDDPSVREQRRERREALNLEYGRILSNQASEAEVRSYFAERQQVYEDLVTFTTRLLDRYGDVLPERDRGLVGLAQRMHRERLEELPRRLAEALERREAHAAVVEAWRRDEALFNAPEDALE